MTTLPFRVARRIDLDESGCWLWTGAKTGAGYGSSRGREGLQLVHRMMFEFAYGEIPQDHQVHHDCGVRSCVNPQHLIALTPVQHNARHGHKAVLAATELRLSRTHCKRGHPLSGTNLYVTPTGKRDCRTCRTAANRARRERSQVGA